MKIAYRRMSGPIGVSELEVGMRGLWWEKRRSLVKLLKSRGHEVDFVSRMTKFSERGPKLNLRPDHELLMIEFGSRNLQFYGKDLQETQAMVRKHRGRIIFLCDDPDLPYLWDTVDPEDYGRWSVWMNCFYPQPFGSQPKKIKCYDFPFALYQNPKIPISTYQKDHFVYLGRPGGRKKVMEYLLSNKAPLQIYSKPKDWVDFPGSQINIGPDQPLRSIFYQSQLGCLALADTKHKELGWRTGRAYHALMAGCPVVVEADNQALASLFHSFRSINDLLGIKRMWSDPEKRAQDWKEQLEWLIEDRDAGEQTLKDHGL